MRLFSTLLIFCLFINANAQFNSNSFEVTLSDLETNVYEKDSTARSLIIYEKGNSYIDKESFDLVTEVERKIKILNKKDNHSANIEVVLYNSDNKRRKEKIKKIEAITYNVSNGNIQKLKLKEQDIFEERRDKNHIITKFTLPNIKNGSVITYKYTIITPFIYKYQPWYFQHKIPTLYSEYNTNIPGNYEYHIKLVGFKKLDIEEVSTQKRCIVAKNGGIANCIISKYAMNDIPAIIEEKYNSSLKNYYSRIEYELKTINHFDGTIDKVTKTWKDTDKELRSHNSVGKQINKNAGDILPSSILTLKNSLEKAQSIYRFVQENYNWNGKQNLFKNVSVKNLVKTKSGNVSEINFLLNNLLNTQGITSKVVLISTRNNGLITQLYPQMSDFNYAIVETKINDKYYLLDATDKYLTFGELPFKCLNQYGRKLDFKNGSTWININYALNSSIQQKINLKLNPNEELIEGNIETTYQGYQSQNKKKNYFSNQNDYKQELENTYEDLNISNHIVTCDSKTDSKFIESFNIENEELNIIENKIYLDPFLIKYFESNPFKLQERTYPIDFGLKNTFMTAIQINLGDYYDIEKLPKPKNFRLPENGGALMFSASVSNNNLMLFFRLSFNKSSYSPDYYIALKEFMNEVINIQNKTILVLKKKS